LFQVLRSMQRLGLSQTDLQIHVERIRATNDARLQNEVVEENALTALDMIVGNTASLSLRWDARELASIYLPRCLTPDVLAQASLHALIPSDLLPPRPSDRASQPLLSNLLERVWSDISEHNVPPERCDFFRVPKSAFTSRPAALLSLHDRFTYEALGSLIEARLAATLAPEVVWPRHRGAAPLPSSYATMPLSWESEYIVKADVAAFYESVDHGILALFLGSHLGVRSATTQAIESFLDAVMGASFGLPQGPLSSDLFASAYLLPVDAAIAAEGMEFSRYADDYFIAARSLSDARAKLNRLEQHLHGIGLRLGAEKTRVMRHSTYEAGLQEPSERVARLRDRLRKIAEESLLHLDDSDEVVDRLSELGVEEQTLWDLLYHQTTTMEEVIDSIRERLEPSIAQVYRTYFRQLAASLAQGELPSDMLAAERDARHALVVMATSPVATPSHDLQVILQWFPRSAPAIASYLLALSDSNPQTVKDFLRASLKPTEHPDWATAWLCYVLEQKAGLIDDAIGDVLLDLVAVANFGPLTRVGASRALARSRRLTEPAWRALLTTASPAIRSEMLFSALAERNLYRWSVPELPSSDPLA
jgi:hypothetical protein